MRDKKKGKPVHYNWHTTHISFMINVTRKFLMIKALIFHQMYSFVPNINMKCHIIKAIITEQGGSQTTSFARFCDHLVNDNYICTCRWLLKLLKCAYLYNHVIYFNQTLHKLGNQSELSNYAGKIDDCWPTSRSCDPIWLPNPFSKY